MDRLRGLRLTLLGRSLLLVLCELLANAACWIVAGILFGRRDETRPILNLAILAWTLGLRHAVDADHIRLPSHDHKNNSLRRDSSRAHSSLSYLPHSAIDNATRSLISLGQLPVTCGLFFSLGHSTIVVVVNIAIAISTDVYDRLEGVGAIGGIVGASVSGVFLFIVGLANAIILYRILRRRQKLRQRRELRLNDGETASQIDASEEQETNAKQDKMFMMRIIGPVINFVNRPWKMYPVGVLFGFGFDTASSIALLAVSAIGKKGTDGKGIRPSEIVILPLLFTAGMTLIDSLDSILMLYSYSGFPQRDWALVETKTLLNDKPQIPELAQNPVPDTFGSNTLAANCEEPNTSPRPKTPSGQDQGEGMAVSPETSRRLFVKNNMMSGLSIVLTLMSILVAFSISLITIMGLIGENCRQCREAAEAESGGGLAGRWWRGWANANDNSGYIGAAIIGSFLAIVAGWYLVLWLWKKHQVPHNRA